MRFLFLLLMSTLLAFGGETPERKLLGRSGEESLAGKVVILQVGQDDLVNRQSFRFWQRILDRAEAEEARAVLLEIDTPGGLAFDTRAIIMDELARLEIPLLAWVKREAISAGALIAFAADEIYMASGTTIGSAGLVNSTGQQIGPVMRAKLESSFEATMRSIAGKKGHRIDVLRAMMIVDEDEDRTFGSVTVPAGGLLNLTASEATELVDGEPLLAKGIADSIDEVLRLEGFGDAPTIRPEPTGFERIAWWIAAFSPLLIAVGIGAAWLELKAPGFGVFGAVALGAFALFFFGNNLAGNLAGYELMAVFLLGVVLILLEIFVVPGLIAGTIGGLMVLGSLWFAMADRIDFDRALETDGFFAALDDLLLKPGLMLGLGLLGALVIFYFFGRYLPRIPLFRGLIAEENLAPGVPPEAAREGSVVGVTGTALTALRPSGTVMVEGRKHDAISRHGLIEEGASVRVLEEGMTYVVEPVEPVEPLEEG